MYKVLLFVLMIMLFSCETKELAFVYRYEVITNSKSLSVEYQDKFENTITEPYVVSKWQYSWIQEGTRYLRIKAKNTTLENSNITVRIYRGSEIIAQTTRIGPLNYAEISGLF